MTEPAPDGVEFLRDEPPEPPPPPRAGKTWSFYPFQMVGIPLLLAVVVAAMLGVFGDEDATLVEGQGPLRGTLTHVDRFRYKMIGPLEVTITNVSTTTLAAVEARIDRAYLSRFSNVSFSPSLGASTDEWAVFELGDLAPGESRVVAGELQCEDFGNHPGAVEVEAEGAETVRFAFDTFCFP